MCASAYHTFSNFVSNSRKLKFRPIIIKRLPKPTFSWYVCQAKSIAFKVSLLSTYTVSKYSRHSSVCPSPGLRFPGNSSHSTIITVSVSLLLPMGWDPWVSRWHWALLLAGLTWPHGTVGISLAPHLLRTASSSPQQWPAGPKCFWQASSSWSQWPWVREAITCWCMTGGQEKHILPCCSIQGKKNPQRNFFLQKVPRSSFSDKLKWNETHFIAGNVMVWPDRMPSLFWFPQSQHHGLGAAIAVIRHLQSSSLCPRDAVPQKSQGPLEVV